MGFPIELALIQHTFVGSLIIDDSLPLRLAVTPVAPVPSVVDLVFEGFFLRLQVDDVCLSG